MLNNHIESEIFRSSIEALTFTDCFSLKEIYDYSCDDCYAYCFDETTETSLPSTEYDRLYKRYKRILSTLAKEAPVKKSPEALIKTTKIYDEFLPDSQSNVFNAVIKSAGYHQLGSTPCLCETCFIDNKRNGVNFIELIFLLNVNAAIHYRSLFLLNKPLQSALDKKQAKRMLDNLLDTINTDKMMRLYIDSFFYVLDNIVNKIFNSKAEKFIRIGWLPEELRERKDAFRALETHKKNETKITLKKYEESQFERIFLSENPFLIKDLNESMDDYYAVNYIGYDILPITYALLLKIKIDDEENLSQTREYMFAKEYAHIIQMYIDQAIREVIKIWKKLYSEENT